jgi:hypothetical protein
MNINLNTSKRVTALLTLAISFGLPGSSKAERTNQNPISAQKAVAREYRLAIRNDRPEVRTFGFLASDHKTNDRYLDAAMRDARQDVRYDQPQFRDTGFEVRNALKDAKDVIAERVNFRADRDARVATGDPYQPT